MTQSLSFFQRIGLAFSAFFRVLFNGVFAFQVSQIGSADEKPAPEPTETQTPPPAKPDLSSALRLLGLLQRDGRLIDFLQDDVTSYSDEEVGAAARVVHGGCKKALQAYITVKPIRTEEEGSAVSITKGFDPAEIRLTGNVTGEPPFQGSLVHHGWRSVECKLPDLPAGQDPAILAPAEVEIA